MEHPITDEGVKPPFRDDLYRSPQKLFEFGDETAWKPRRRLWAHIDQEVHIAVGAVIASRCGSENANPRHAVSSRNLENLLAL